jgi:DNA-directed RNA polymerase subunit RPC12/RpoP
VSQCLTCDELKNRAYLNQIHKKLNLIFSSYPCVDCGETEIEVLEFDSDAVWNAIANEEPWVQVNKIIAKSQVVCANCNRRRLSEKIGRWGIPNPT